jgi:hypothetical protein
MFVLMLLATVAFAFFTFMSLFALAQDDGESFKWLSSWCCACTVVLFQCVRHLFWLYREQKLAPET